MKKMIKVSYKFFVGMAMFLSITGAQAALVSFTADGTVETADFGNAYALNVSDIISASGVFDDAGFTGSGLESFATTLSLGVGAASFNETNDAGLTEIVFDNGVFVGFNFFMDTNVASEVAFFDSTFDFFNGEDVSGYYVDGTWNAGSYSVVPVPAAAWLFGSGLLALAGFFRKRNKSE